MIGHLKRVPLLIFRSSLARYALHQLSCVVSHSLYDGCESQWCYQQLASPLPAVHDLCQDCPARQFNPNRMFCCSKGLHQMPRESIIEMADLHEFFDDCQQLLIDHGREVNQLCSFTAVGVCSSTSVLGGIQPSLSVPLIANSKRAPGRDRRCVGR